MSSSTFNKHCAGRQFSVSNPPKLKAANRYKQVEEKRQLQNDNEILLHKDKEEK